MCSTKKKKVSHKCLYHSTVLKLKDVDDVAVTAALTVMQAVIQITDIYSINGLRNIIVSIVTAHFHGNSYSYGG